MQHIFIFFTGIIAYILNIYLKYTESYQKILLENDLLKRKDQIGVEYLQKIFANVETCFVWEFELIKNNPEKCGFRWVTDGCKTIHGHTSKECLQNMNLIVESMTEESKTKYYERMTNPPKTDESKDLFELKNGKSIEITFTIVYEDDERIIYQELHLTLKKFIRLRTTYCNSCSTNFWCRYQTKY